MIGWGILSTQPYTTYENDYTKKALHLLTKFVELGTFKKKKGEK